MKASTTLAIGGGATVLIFSALLGLAAGGSAPAADGGSSTRIPTEPLPPHGTRVAAKRTVMSARDVARAIRAQYTALTGRALTWEQTRVLAAQWAVETGYGRNVFNYNVGNVKASSGWKGQYTVLLTWEWKPDKQRWYAPFRAYPDINAGVRAWLSILLSERHRPALAHALAVHPRQFGAALANRADGGTGYATARASHYGSAVEAAFNKLAAS